MSEFYPDDASLLALVEDGQTGVPYIETGKTPYYREFRQTLYRLIANLTPLGLRPFKTGPLAVRVKPGMYWLAGAVHTFAGSSADVTLTDNATNYFYMQADGTIGVSASGWPGTEHIKLATIVTASGAFDVSAIVDVRGGSMLSSLGSTLATTPAELNALHGISSNVTAANLSALAGGAMGSGAHVGLAGQFAQANGTFAAAGDAQATRYLLRGVTTNNTPAELVSPARFTLTPSKTYALTVYVAGRIGSTGMMGGLTTATAVFDCASDGTVTNLDQAVVSAIGAFVAGWNLLIDEDNTHGAVRITVTGDSATTIHWVACIDAVEIG